MKVWESKCGACSEKGSVIFVCKISPTPFACHSANIRQLWNLIKSKYRMPQQVNKNVTVLWKNSRSPQTEACMPIHRHELFLTVPCQRPCCGKGASSQSAWNLWLTTVENCFVFNHWVTVVLNGHWSYDTGCIRLTASKPHKATPPNNDTCPLFDTKSSHPCYESPQLNNF